MKSHGCRIARPCRFKKWVDNGGEAGSESGSDSGSESGSKNHEAPDWEFGTIKGTWWVFFYRECLSVNNPGIAAPLPQQANLPPPLLPWSPPLNRAPNRSLAKTRLHVCCKTCSSRPSPRCRASLFYVVVVVVFFSPSGRPQSKKKLETENAEHSAASLALIAELGKAFELAEVSKPGVCDMLVQEICKTMAGCVGARFVCLVWFFSS